MTPEKEQRFAVLQSLVSLIQALLFSSIGLPFEEADTENYCGQNGDIQQHFATCRN